ncbi:MAG: hypothetical protein MUP61_04440 [Burkholderiales bacterium]|nr:hypothetical protein [Burkholderiales bacterium]MCJ7838449.1 hypothetical protein [Burkholderiales bacterium]
MRSGAARGLALLGVLALTGLSAHAEELTICYNYGCYAKAPVVYAEERLEAMRQQLAAAGDAAAEREVISVVIGRMYAIAGEQTPVWRDRGGNYADGGDNGKMDCIDHSTNTSAFLSLFQARGWLRFHEVLEPFMRTRFFIADHWAARIRERETQKVFIVDSWFFDNGQPAAVLPFDDWLAGKTPSVY